VDLTADAGLHVAFFRNLNLGQPRSKSPGSAALVAAFTAAGASGVRNFQTNGTVLFRAADTGHVVDEVRESLDALTGYGDAVVVRPASWLMQLGGRLDPTLPGGEVCLFDAANAPALVLPWTDPRFPSLTIHALDRRHAVTSWTDARQGPSGNRALTTLTGVPVTCRGIPTMLRLGALLRAG
jgi:hypothetical protein